MTRLDRSARMLALVVAVVAGFTDAVGYLASGGFFVSFMSGNSTRLGVGVATEARAALIAATLIAGFVAGATAGFVAGHRGGRRRHAAVLALFALLLGAGTIAGELLGPRIGLILLASAMGAVNALFEEGGEVRIGLTYMTGTLVKIGHRLARAIRGGEPFGWLPFAMMWGGLLGGGALGATAYLRLGLGVMWLPAAIAALLATLLYVRPLREPVTR